MEQINAWLASEEKDYQTGVQLYLKHGKNRVLANNFLRKENAFNREKLAYELGKLAFVPKLEITLVPVAPTIEPAEPTEPVAPNEPTSDQQPTEEPEIDVNAIDAIILRQSSIFNERAKLSNTLADLTTDEQRKAVADQIESLTEEYNKLAEKKVRIENGTEPAEQPQEPAQPVDKAALLLTRNNLRSQLTKAKNVLASKPEDAEKQEKVVKLKHQLDELEIRIKLN